MVIFFPLILLFVSSACGPDLPTETEQILPGDGVRLESTWEYRWGDSPRAESGDFLWLKEVGPDANLPSPPQQDRKPDSENDDPGKQGSVGWSHLPFPAQPPGRQGNTFIWQRVQIPEGQWRDPALYIYSVDTIFEAYADGKQIYRYGNLDVERPAFEGWPFHLIALPRNIEGKYLYLRVYSDYPDIGVFYRIVLDDRADLIEWLLLSRVEFLAIAGALIVIGAFAFLHFLRTRESWTHLAFSLVCLTEGYRALADSMYPQYMYPNMLLWHYTSWVALFIFIPALLAFFRSIYTGTERVIMTYLYRIQLAISAIYTGYLFWDLQGAMVSVPFRIFALICIVAIFSLEIRRAARGNRDARIILVGFAVYGLNASATMLMDMGLLPDLRLNTHYSLFVFVCALGLVVIRRYGIMREENVRYALVSEELETARRLHQSLLPADPPEIDGLDLSVAYISQASLGGDYYDFIRIDRRQVGVMIADVSGHGLPAALGVSMAKIAFSEHTSLAHRPERLLELTRVSLVDKLQRQFLTAGALYINMEQGLFRYASAGHPPLAFVSADRSGVDWIRPRGHLMAPLPFRGYRMVERELKPGDRLVLYTDGLSECRNPDGEFYNARRMAEALKEAPVGARNCTDYIIEDLRHWCRSNVFEDDVAVVVAECRGA
ncbi:MAG: SpoIIE family protein phosphatase [Leptospiraceae bacterium]|nr:SpoIIE family protein phosphatase [Leptospiraceae bacterium]